MLIKVQLFFLLLITPFLGVFLAFAQDKDNPYISSEKSLLQEEFKEIEQQNEAIKTNLFEKRELITEVFTISRDSNEILDLIEASAFEELQDYVKQQERIGSFVEASTGYQQQSADLIEHLLATMLGDPVGQTYGDNSIVKIYSLQEAGYRGYMAKVRLQNPNAIKMVLANDEVPSNGETTSQAAKRTGAVLAINAGGFARQNGKMYPMGITVVDGEVVTFFDTTLSFIGFNQSGNLVGGEVTSREQIKEMGVQQGASFLPTLLKGNQKQPIASKWANTRQPRTLIGHFTNGDLFFMVIDGRQKDWSSGVTLEEAQDKLLQFNIQDAYNLDGGGSSTFYYDGEVLNKPSGGQQRKVTTNIVVIP